MPGMRRICFPLRLVARRGVGVPVAEGRCRFASESLPEPQVVTVDPAIARTVQYCREAWRRMLLRCPGDSALHEAWANLSGSELAIDFVREHEYLLELDREGRLLIACDWLAVDGKEMALNGAVHVLELGFWHLFLCRRDWSERRALAKVAEIHAAFSKDERAALHDALDGGILDSGKVFSLFLERTIKGDAAEDPVWRDRQITWLLGQDRIDLPYRRQAALEILHGADDADTQRARLYRLLRDYDRDLERRNIERIASEVRAAGQQLIFGRMSRAFHNQATLFANAALLRPDSEWSQLVRELVDSAAATPALQAGAGVLAAMLAGAEDVALAALEGACERFEEAVLDAQRSALAEALASARARVEDHDDPLLAESVPPADQDAIMTRARQVLYLAARIRQALLAADKRHAAYVVISQRPSPTGAHLLVKINEFEDPYLGKAENLRKLVRLAGDRIYSSPDYGWLAESDHWIEAIPLFIKEEVLVHEGQESTRTVIDISGMEASFREEMADYWALNLRRVLESEWLCLARECVAGGKHPDAEAEADDIAGVAVLIGELYLRHIGDIHKRIEAEELPPYAALRQVLVDGGLPSRLDAQHQSTRSWRAAALAKLRELGYDKDFDAEVARLSPQAFTPRRALPALHVLTTQSAGMTDGYIRTWLEESMALFNIAEDLGLHQSIAEREAFFAARILHLGEKIIRELGVWIEVEAICADEQIEQGPAILRLLGRSRALQEEVSCLGALLEFDESRHGCKAAEACAEPDAVEDYLHRHREALQTAALEKVIERNRAALLAQTGDDSDEALADEDYRQDLAVHARHEARRRVLAAWAAEHPEQYLPELCASYLRRFQQLAKTTARKQIIAENGLNHLALHPRYYFQATGGGKRYHLLYTPSRVDLGKRERESVETWAQWVGGADRAAARAGRRLYSLINKDVRAFDSLTEPEILKTGENASMAAHFAFSNALSMMISASAHGDFEAMADLMNRRRDRLVHPAGEGYGGYCVPKDGLFLAFVLTLNRTEKLRQIGLPDACHQAVIALANRLLDRRPEFAGQFEWEQWAAEQLRREDCLRPYFAVSRGVPVFQITRIAHVLEHLGRPQLGDPYRVASALSAGWGLRKMVTGGEQVNRFMPFFKAWLIRQALGDAARRHPQASIAIENCVLVLTAEYKPDTQDARFSTGLRKFEIMAGCGDHLLNALDLDGKAIALLLHEGYEAVRGRGWGGRIRDLLEIGANDAAALDRLRHLFPAAKAPAEIRMVAPTGLSTQDLLNYTSDTRLAALADETQQELLALGLSIKEIEANLCTWGARLKRWDTRAPALDAKMQEKLRGPLHVLALAMLGPERDYRQAAQGADVLDTGIPHRGLLDLLADPAQLCRLMLAGNPNSALAIVDGAAGARHRAMNRDDVMLWFAAAERLGRESVYHCVGVGQHGVEAWRAEMRRRRRRAERLWRALTCDVASARQIYERLVDEMCQDHEIQQAFSESDKLNRFGRGGERGRIVAEALGRIGGGLALEELGFSDFLALGGLYLFVGASAEALAEAEDAFASASLALGGSAQRGDARQIALLLPTEERTLHAEIRQEKNIESSNKAMEESPSAALETRRQLAARIAEAQALNLRYRGFTSTQNASGDFDELYRKSFETLGSGDRPVDEESFGAFLQLTRQALIALAESCESKPDPEVAQGMVARVRQLFSGRQLDEQIYRRIAGGYEDIGDFGRLAQHLREGFIDAEAKEQGLMRIAQGAELFYCVLAIDCTIGYTRQAADDAPALWRALPGFFAETLNDHCYEYRPWVYSRGIGFADYQGEALYRLAVQHHRWLYRYLRFVLTHYTELQDLPAAEQDLLLGNYLDGNETPAIGAGADGEAEKIWRAYGQLREVAFIRGDGFALPVVFSEFDPDLIRGRERVNHVIAAPVGRTHFSRMLCEGPTLARQLEAEGRRGANIIITRKLDVVSLPQYRRPVAVIDSGHFYLDATDYITALVRHKGYSRQQASALAAGIHPKGIRVAARFSRPVLAALVYPFHGDPLYDQGQLEDCGLPYTVQSLFHTWTTYDKAKYRDIFAGSGVDMPEEINWLAADNARGADKARVKHWIEHGLDGLDYPGLAAFARRHPLVMIKDAAESGGRNAQAFQLRQADGSLDAGQVGQAVEFVYQIALKHNVCIQEVVLSSPEHWATEAFMRAFVHRQIVEWGSPVNRQRQPHTQVFGSHRIILSTDQPNAADRAQKWHISHWITLNSKQLITNVGRGGLLEQLLPEYIRPEHRQTILDKLASAGRRVMEALAAYETRALDAYAAATGRQVGSDLTGVSYGVPRYLMLDFLIAPIFAQEGVLAEIEPIFDDHGRRAGSRFMLLQDGRLLAGTIADWRVVLIEPNIGVGLWDRVALREEQHELERAGREGGEPDWDLVGENARIVLRDLNRAGEDYLDALDAGLS